MDSVSVKVHAKINLSLNVCGKTDNYHVLDTVMTSVDIADVVSVRKSRVLLSKCRLTSERSGVFQRV